MKACEILDSKLGLSVDDIVDFGDGTIHLLSVSGSLIQGYWEMLEGYSAHALINQKAPRMED